MKNKNITNKSDLIKGLKEMLKICNDLFAKKNTDKKLADLAIREIKVVLKEREDYIKSLCKHVNKLKLAKLKCKQQNIK